MGERASQEGAGKFGIPLKAAGRQDHAAPRHQPVSLTRQGVLDTDHRAVLDQQPSHGRIQHRLNTAIQAACQQGADQRLAEAAQVVLDTRLKRLHRRHCRCAAQRRLAQHQALDHSGREYPIAPSAELVEVE